MDFMLEVMPLLRKGMKARLPEWLGYWFLDGGTVNHEGDIELGTLKAFTRTGDVVDAWSDDVVGAATRARTDWQIVRNGLSFSWALIALQAGKKVRRKCWRGKGKFLFLLQESVVPASVFIDETCRKLAEESDGAIECSATIRMFRPGKKGSHRATLTTGWVPQQDDMFADNWELAE